MSTVIEELLALFEIDQHLVTLKRKLEAGPKEIQEQEGRIIALREERRAAETVIKEKAAAVDQCNLEIRTAEAESDDQEDKLKGIKNNKEYKIVTSRIKELKQTIAEQETKALGLMEELDALRGGLQEKLDAVTEAENRIEALKVEIEAEKEEIRDAGRSLKEQRDPQIQKIQTMDSNAMAVYAMAFRRGQGIALAEMKGATCQACFRNANANIENTVLVGRDIKKCICAGCGRILYTKNPVNVDSATE